jgi:glucan phosphoethanolaminetransferase (alkaline phosphatase superfamily)
MLGGSALPGPVEVASLTFQPHFNAISTPFQRHLNAIWRSLLSVDDLIQAVVDKLEAGGVMDKTFIFYTSDHGYKQATAL